MRTTKKSSALLRNFIALLAVAAIASVAACTSGSDDTATNDDRFWAGLRINGDEVEGYASIGAMKEAADSVVLATFDKVGTARSIKGDAAEDVVYYLPITLHVEKVLAGRQVSSGFRWSSCCQ